MIEINWMWGLWMSKPFPCGFHVLYFEERSPRKKMRGKYRTPLNNQHFFIYHFSFASTLLNNERLIYWSPHFFSCGGMGIMVRWHLVSYFVGGPCVWGVCFIKLLAVHETGQSLAPQREMAAFFPRESLQFHDPPFSKPCFHHKKWLFSSVPRSGFEIGKGFKSRSWRFRTVR